MPQGIGTYGSQKGRPPKNDAKKPSPMVDALSKRKPKPNKGGRYA